MFGTIFLKPLYIQMGIGNSHTSGRCHICTSFEDLVQILLCLDSSSEVYTQRGCFGHSSQYLAVDHMLASGAIKVHHVKSSVSCLFESDGHLHRVAILLALLIVTLCEANTSSAYDIYSWYQFYHISPRKLVKIRSPTLPLFSG